VRAQTAHSRRPRRGPGLTAAICLALLLASGTSGRSDTGGQVPPRLDSTQFRQLNLLLHLLYKALFELSPNRAEFVARLFARAGSLTLGPGAPARELFEGLRHAPAADPVRFDRQFEDVTRVLSRLRLSQADVARIRLVHASFRNHGPDISYTTRLTGDRGPGIATYPALMTQGHRVALPSALMPILAEVPACRRVTAGTHLR
jgi:hypothetical protein